MTTVRPTTMIKRFTLKKIEHKIISKKKGMLTYIVVDENNTQRTVASVTSLDRRGEIKSRKAVYKREIPLVDALTGLALNQSLTVDFSDFNKTFKRSKVINRGSAYHGDTLLSAISGSNLLPIILKYSAIAFALYGVFYIYIYLADLFNGIY
ncbi:MAG: hypothetical protein KAH22_11420 [Thiotrichaceae bacterium]|nr:hypothetical protein [Thiotrichaceae bacterium]